MNFYNDSLYKIGCLVPFDLTKEELLEQILSCLVETSDMVTYLDSGITREEQARILTYIYKKILEYNQNPTNTSKIGGIDKGLPELRNITINPDTIDENELKVIFETHIVPGTLVKLSYNSKKGYGHAMLIYLSPNSKKPTLVENQKAEYAFIVKDNINEETELTEGYDNIIEYIKKK